MKFIRSYFVALLTFLVIDAVWISLVVAEAYREVLGTAMLTDPRMGAAVVFYLGYVAFIVLLAVEPARKQRSSALALRNGALLGGFGYGTYAVTNYAVLADWTWHLVWTDIAWGIFISAATAGAGYLAAGKE